MQPYLLFPIRIFILISCNWQWAVPQDRRRLLCFSGAVISKPKLSKKSKTTML